MNWKLWIAETFVALVIIAFGVGIMLERKFKPVAEIPPPVIKVEEDWFLQTAADIFTRAADVIGEKDERKKELKLVAVMELCELYNKRSLEIGENWNIKCPRIFTYEYLFDRTRVKTLEKK